MSQQTWIITFNTEEEYKDEQAHILRDFLHDALPEIKITPKTKNTATQNGNWVDLVIQLAAPGGVIIALIHTISLYLKYTHNASINIEIEGNKVKKYECKNITSKTSEKELCDVLDHLKHLEEDAKVERNKVEGDETDRK